MSEKPPKSTVESKPQPQLLEGEYSRYTPRDENQLNKLIEQISTSDEEELLSALDELSKLNDVKKNAIPTEVIRSLVNHSVTASSWMRNNDPRFVKYYGGMNEYHARNYIFPALEKAFSATGKSELYEGSVFYLHALDEINKLESICTDNFDFTNLLNGTMRGIRPLELVNAFGAELNRSHSYSYENQHSLTSWKTAFRNLLFSLESPDLQKSCVQHVDLILESNRENSFDEAMEFLRAIFSFDTVHASKLKETIKTNKELATQIWEKVRQTLDLFVMHTQRSSFVNLYIQSLQKRTGNKIEDWELSDDGMSESSVPFQVSPNQYAWVTRCGEEKILLISKSEEYEQITKEIEDHTKLEILLQPIWEKKSAALERHISRWSDEPWFESDYKEYYATSNEENEYRRSTQILRSFFFEIDEKPGFSRVPRPDRILDMHDKDFLSIYAEDMRPQIESFYCFQLKDLTIQEQINFLNYLKHVKVSDAELMKRFTSLHGVDGMRTFLSLERGDESLGDRIVAFGKHAEVASTVFRYYGDLLNSADRAEQLVREASDCTGDQCTALAAQVRENILNRAQKDLEKAVQAHDPSEVVNQIENYVATAKEYVALLQEVGSLIESIPAHNLSIQDKEEMRALQKNRYEYLYPGDTNKPFREDVFASLQNAFDKPHVDINILRHHGKIICFNRFETRKDATGKEVSYFGSFNADPAYSGAGGVMLEQTIRKRLLDGCPMMAHCDPTQDITKKYIEEGFFATRLGNDLAGHTDFEIWRSQDSDAQLESKSKNIEELLFSYKESGSIVMREQSEPETYPELQDGKALTRYFTHQGKTYLVFETLPQSLRFTFITPQDNGEKTT